MIGQESRCCWYVVRSKRKQEQRAESNLRAWGLETFMPKLRTVSAPAVRAGVRYKVEPLFPGYLFARFDTTREYAKVRLTRGVHSVVGFGECATPVDDAIIALIRSRINDDGLVHEAEPSPGDQVEIVSGPLCSVRGIFERALSGGDRVLILLTTVGSSARVQVSRAVIRKARTSLVA